MGGVTACWFVVCGSADAAGLAEWDCDGVEGIDSAAGVAVAAGVAAVPGGGAVEAGAGAGCEPVEASAADAG